jgi:hypothetical protein
MNTPDVVNGAFEVLGGLMIWLNVRALRRDRMVRGIDWRVTWFFTLWGFWNLFYYPSLDQWASFVGGLVIASGNVAWLALVIKYRRS